ncbi:MAG: amidase [Pseudomonadota bacterium]
MSEVPPNGLTATEALQKISEGWLSSVELVTACLDRIEETESQLHAWAHLDRDHALEQAAEMDVIRQSGKPMGALHGIPVGVKDIVDTTDFPTGYGSSIYDARRPEADATIVNRLREAGAVILGKTETAEFAFVTPPETRNPHNPQYSPGGSSSGSAAAVAGYHVPVSIGTQTGGSVIRPASYCGTFGFKPTSGVISRNGLLQTSKTLDQPGVFGRSLEDAALLADVIASYDPADSDSYPRPRPQMLSGLKSELPVEPDLVWLDLPFSDRLTEDTKEGMDEIIQSLGARVERIEAPDFFGGLLETQQIIHEYEICQHLAETFETRWDEISDPLKAKVEDGRKISPDEYQHELGVRDQVIGFFSDFFMDFDAILTPSATGEPPKFEENYTGDPAFCQVWTLAGLPCLNLPLLVSDNNMPIGVQLVSGREEDDRLFRTANWLLTELG